MFHATTILAYKGKNKAVIGGDGQVSFGNTVLKGNATKIRTLYKGQILAGFAGSTADAFNLFDMFEAHLETCKGDLLKSVIAFSKEWRKDKYLRRLEAMMIVLNKEKIFIKTFKFGKYKDRNIEEVFNEDMGYINWFMKNTQLVDDMEDILVLKNKMSSSKEIIVKELK
jgi:uncharacterized protein (DUF3820 family)